MPQPNHAAPEPRDLAADNRGAIMVLGIYMCVILVGALSDAAILPA
jgi:hypothetical protein